jgi:2-amino-4-hydroxy-6-hydroxymethyldihydropteridine diphosphokinase
VRERVFVGLGSNIGDGPRTLADALAVICELPGLELACASSVFRTVPVGAVPQAEFTNQAVELQTGLSPRALLDALLSVEAQFMRVRTVRWGPRTLDLDLLLFGSRVVRERGLAVPHPELARRGFVLGPLSEIAGEFVHPVSGRTMRELYATWVAKVGGPQRFIHRVVAVCPHAMQAVCR